MAKSKSSAPKKTAARKKPTPKRPAAKRKAAKKKAAGKPTARKASPRGPSRSRRAETQPRQRLLYLHARTPSPFSEILGYTPIEPVAGYRVEIVADEQDWPYRTVHDAIVDGWQVVQFPHLQAPYDDRDLDVVGYEFILQKMTT